MRERSRSWLDLRPRLRVTGLAWANLLHRWPLAGAALALLPIAMGVAAGASGLERSLDAAAKVPLLVLGGTLVAFAAMIERIRRRLASNRHRDWLAALPSDLPLTARAAALPGALWVGVAVAATIAALFASDRLQAFATLIMASAAGLVAAIATVAIGAAIGERRAARPSRSGREVKHVPAPSRYAFVRGVRASWATRAQLTPLGYWPVAQAKYSQRPKNQARSLVLLLLGLPLDVPGAVALAAAAVWLVTLHLVNLFLAVVRVALAASWWLAPTPVGAMRFAAAVCHRAMVGEIAGCAVLVALAEATAGARGAHLALPYALTWLAAVCLVSAGVCCFALRTVAVARSPLHRWMT